MAKRRARDSEGNIVYYESSEDEFGSTKWNQYTPSNQEKKYLDRKRTKGPSANLIKGQNKQALLTKIGLEQRGEASKQRAREAADMSTLEKMPIVAGRETDKLLAGTANVYDFIAHNLGSDEAMGRTANRMNEQAGLDEMYKELGEREGLASIAAMAPYLVTGRVIDPLSAKVTDKLFSLAGKTGDKIGKGGKAVSDVVAETAESSHGLLQKLSAEAKEKFIDPVATASGRMKAQPRLNTSYRDTPVKDVAKSVQTGAVEGTLHHDETSVEGAFSSGLGSGLGMVVEPYVSKAKKINDKNTDQVLDWWKDKGYRVLPGMDTGQPKFQRFESDLRSSDGYSGYFKQFDDVNDEVVMKVAGESMGLDIDQMKGLTPDSLGAHLSDLRGQFDALENASIGKIDKVDIIDMAKKISSLSKDDAAAVKPLFKEMSSIKQTSGRDGKGRFTAATFGGKDYKKIRARVKTAADSAFKQGKMERYNAYNDMLKTLDSGMEAGVAKHGGKASADGQDTQRQR